jgi:putative spermidine/putrescine transport system substrate-binding protein
MRGHRYKTIHFLLLIVTLISLLACSEEPGEKAAEQNWEDIVTEARGQTVDWFMWGGSPAVNAYVNGYVADQLKAQYDITLRQGPVQDIAEVVSKLVIEKQAGKDKDGHVDLMWINGENFRTCKKNGLLYGPFADRLPNQRLVNWDRPSVANDFGEPVEGLESPWGSAQVVMIYDTARVPQPPRTVGDLLKWIRSHPGRFAYPAPPDFTGSVFVRHIFYHVSGGAQRWQGPMDQAAFDQAASDTYRVLRELAPFLWREGQTYPESPVRMNTLFADGEVDFSFSYHQAEASRNILDGLFPDTVRTLCSMKARLPIRISSPFPSMPPIRPAPWWWPIFFCHRKPSSKRRPRTSGETSRSSIRRGCRRNGGNVLTPVPWGRQRCPTPSCNPTSSRSRLRRS